METAITESTDVAETVQCKNCGTAFAGNFCNQCGQKYINQRYNLRDGISHLFSTVINIDRGLWHTCFELLRNPGKVINGYLNGITIRYFHPFRFVFLLLTLSVFLMVVTGAYDVVQESFAVRYTGNYVPDIQKRIMTGINSYMHIMLAVSIPILALASWLFFRSSKLNYAEHLIINSFAYGETVLLGMLFLIAYAFSDEAFLALNFLAIPLSIAYLTYAYMSIFKGSKIIIFLKALGTYLIWFFGFGLMVMAITIVYMIRMIQQNPEIIEQFKQNTG